MKRVSQIAIVSLATGMAILQLSCDDATADGKKQSGDGEKQSAAGEPAKAESGTPAQPSKPVIKTEEEWKKILTPEQFEILRKHGTERACRSQGKRR